ncbi:hypothetical protein VNO77_25240 [Canavalia gladiata]|uniref:Uncharacterized protein n=1 Tax=Canavalia gladiata TaxID=3824 RepID=A0AAN9L942_CANGL
MGHIRSTKLTLRQRQSEQKNKFVNKVGPFSVLELINSTPTHFDFGIALKRTRKIKVQYCTGKWNTH